MYNFPVLSQLILLLHWVLVTINDFLSGLGLGYSWTWGLAIIGLTIIVRLILFPLTWKQYKSAQQMQMIQPQIKELQKKYKSDRGKLQEETMKLYSEHRVNPFASCLPLILQLPVFISLYAAIKGLGPLSAPAYQASVELLNQAPFLWIPHLGRPGPVLRPPRPVRRHADDLDRAHGGDAERQDAEVDHARDADHVRRSSCSTSRRACSCTGSRRTSGPSASS